MKASAVASGSRALALVVAALFLMPLAKEGASAATWHFSPGIAGTMAFGPDGGLYVSDCGAARIYRVGAAGLVTVFAGSGPGSFDNGYSGDGGPAIDAHFACPVGLAFDDEGNLFVADHLNNVIRRIDTAGIVTTVAGTGPPAKWWFKGPSVPGVGTHSGDGGLATQASLDRPWGVTFDSQGNLYIADRDEDTIRRVDTSGIITSVAGTGQRGYNGDGVSATDARLDRPLEVVFDVSGSMYIADENNSRIRKVDSNGVITTVGGTGDLGCLGTGGPATAAPIQNPNSIGFGSDGSLFMTEAECHFVRKIDTHGILQAAVGTGDTGCAGLNGGSASAAQLTSPDDLTFDGRGNMYVSDWDCGAILRIDATGRTHVFATLPTG